MQLFKNKRRKATTPKPDSTKNTFLTKLAKYTRFLNFTRKMKIAPKLLIGFLIIAVLGVGMGLFATISLKEASANSSKMYKEMLLPMRNIMEVARAIDDNRISLRTLLLVQDETRYILYTGKINNNFNGFNSTLGTLEALISDDSQEAFQTVKTELANYKTLLDKYVKEIQSGNKQPAITDLTKVGDLYQSESSLSDAINKLNFAVTQKSTKLDSDTQKSAELVFAVTLSLVGLLLVLSLLIGISTARGISLPVKKLTDAVTLLAAGETEITPIVMNTKDEISQMNDAFKSIWISIKELTCDTDTLIEAAKEGRLSVRADADKHHGAYKKIIEGFNETLDAVTKPVEEAANVLGEVSQGNLEARVSGDFAGDYAIIKNSLNSTIDTLKMLVADTDMLTEAAVEGRLSERADAQKHSGAYKKILEGINATLDAVINPVNEAVRVLGEVSKGNLSVSVEGDFAGDHALIKDSLNHTIKALNGYIGEISAVLNEVSIGNLDVGITSDYLGDFSALKDSINMIVESLNDMLADISAAAEQMASGTRQLSDGSQSISQGATEQAGAIEELTGTIADIADQTRQNALNANKANELSISARDNAHSGNEKIKAMQNAMTEITEASASISKIIKEIDSIAFQTNILALNAAVEAARAGEHGRGFAVVAEEVRNLAARSAGAAQNTAQMIEGSIKKAETGAKIADDTAASLLSIVSGVEKAVQLVGEIAAASNEQATGISQVNKGISQMSAVVQTNSATVEEAAASAQELSAQAEMLKNMVVRFKLKNNMEQPGANIPAETINKPTQKQAKGNAAGKTQIILNEQEFGKY
jgi:methyl-accepting chemotaxis protein